MFWRRLVIGILLAINLLLLYRLLWSDKGYFKYRELEGTSFQLEEKLAALERQNMRLSKEIRALQDDRQYIEAMIREHMKYVKENEILYLPEKTMNASQGEIAHGQQN